MLRTLFLVNPRAGRGGARATWKRLERLVAGRRDLEAIIPSSYAETRRLAAEAVKNGLERVIAVGGDGTLDAVADELAGSETIMGAIPAGTGNDFCKTTGIPLRAEAALEVALNGAAQAVDLGLAPGKRHFLNVAGVGFDADVATLASGYPSGLGGTLPYLLGALTTIIRWNPVEITVEVDGQRYDGPITLTAIANGPQYGGGMRIAPTARRDDGLFDVYVAEALSRGQLLKLLPQVYSGAHVKHPGVHLLRGEHVRIVPRGPIHAHVDGDLIDPGSLTFRVRPRALRVALPGAPDEVAVPPAARLG